jgi:hypothetical protein
VKKKITAIFGTLLMVTVFMSIGNGPVFADSDGVIIIEKLKERGIITKQHADEIIEAITEKQAMEEKTRADIPIIKRGRVERRRKPALPEQLSKIHFGAKAMLRYQLNKTGDENGDRERRSRIRMSLYPEISSQVLDQWEVGFGLALGGGAPPTGAQRTKTVTLRNGFDTKEITLNKLYAQYKPHKMFSIIGGKFENPLWQADQILWDSDLTVEGAAINFAYINLAIKYPSVDRELLF